MLLIYRSILKELISTLLLSLLFLNFTLMMEHLLRLSKVLVGMGTSLFDMGKLIIYLQPQILILTIPMAMLLSVLIVYGRMNADNELTVMRGTGMSFREISRPVAYLGLGCLVTGIIMSFFLGPLGSSLLRHKLMEILTTQAPMTIEEGIFNTAFKDIVILVQKKPSPDKLAGIHIIDEREKGQQRVIIAEEGRIIPEADALSFSLTKGHIYIIKKSVFTEISFGRYFFRLAPSAEPQKKKSNELTPFELLSEAKKNPEKRASFLLDFHRRISMLALCLILIPLGPALSLMSGKTGKLGGLTVGLSVFAFYYVLLIYGESLGRSGKLPLATGAWFSFAVIGIFSLWVFKGANRR
ncbi:MAG: LptF/LptG family permease [Thermodesulfovibrionales bacterium]|jgi:lipopolysaccharide export system permease protein